MPWPFYGALVVLAVGLVAGVYSLWPRDWCVVPEPGPLLDKHNPLMPEFTIGELLTTKAKAFEHNVPVTHTKANRIRVQWFCSRSAAACSSVPMY